MEKIVNIQGRIESKKQKEQLRLKRGKIEAIQKVIQCSSCQLRCAMCGLHIKVTESHHDSDSPFEHSFCDSCRGEFEDFLSVSKGEKHSDVFWHNDAWVHMWKAWVNYRKAITGFINSPEFKLLVEELNKQA